MFTNLQAHTDIVQRYGAGRDTRLAARLYAWKLFEKAYTRGRRHRLLAVLTRKPYRLELIPPASVAGRHTTATVVVPLANIVGSVSRSLDFDLDFNPVNADICERWIGIAVARLRGVGLPAVELVQVDGQYYVRDGHHRISVARAFGQLDIEARIVN